MSSLRKLHILLLPHYYSIHIKGTRVKRISTLKTVKEYGKRGFSEQYWIGDFPNECVECG